MDQVSEHSLALDEAVGDVALPAQLRQPEHQLNGVNVAGDDHELSLLLFDELGHVVETKLDDVGLLGFDSLALLLRNGSSLKSGLLGLVVLGRVLFQELDQGEG